MTCHKILFTLSVSIALSAVTAQYDTYENSDEEDERSDERPTTDYSKYFGGLGTAQAPGGPTQAADGSAGFVQPLDFTGIFAPGHFGLDGQWGGESQHVFKTPGGTLPLQSRVFSANNVPVTSNTSGFVNDAVKFPSLFDSSSSSSENGFRPQDFLQQGSHPEATSPSTYYSPAFTNLQRDVDREVDYQQKEEDYVERSRTANRRNPKYGSEDDEDDDSDSFEFDDGPENEHRSSHNQYKKPHQKERHEGHKSSNRKESGYKTPYSTSNQARLSRPSQPLIVNQQIKNLLPYLPEEDYDYDSPVSSNMQRSKHNKTPLRHTSYDKNNAPNSRGTAQHYHYPTHPKHLTNPQTYKHTQQTAYRRPITNMSSHYQTQPKHSYTSPQTHQGYNVMKSPSYFRTTPTNQYLNHPKAYTKDRKLSSSEPQHYERDGYSLPQTEYATVVEKTSKKPPKAPYKNKKDCKKINKKIDAHDFARFKRQQMTCYICTNKDIGNTYEECSYESDPKSNTFYKGSPEAYSSDTILNPTKHHIRKRSNTKQRHGRPTTRMDPIRSVRQDDYDDDSSEPGHGQEHYRFGPEYVYADGKKNNENISPKRPLKRTDYDDDYDYDNNDEEETDIEEEYAPPGASDNDNCQKVNRNGLICMVCQKKNGGGTYEQCSYASDPEANKYEYAKSSSYGSKRPEDHRYKRYSVHENYKRKKHKRDSTKKLRGHNKKNLDKMGDFKNGKLKRKKVRQSEYKRPLHQKSIDKNISSEEEYPKIVGIDPIFYGSSEKYNPDDYDERGKKIQRRGDSDDETAASSTEEVDEDSVQTYEDSFYRLFPELVGTDPYTGESIEKRVKQNEAMEKRRDFEHPQIPYDEAADEEESESVQTQRKVKPRIDYGVDLPDYYFNDDAPKKDLEKTLDEFTHKNRTDCKKVMKDKMTCYQCVNKNGLQHEECMFVAASEPKSKHLAYHEVKEFRVTPTENRMNESNPDNSENYDTDEYYGQNYNRTNQQPKNVNVELTERKNDGRFPISNKKNKKYEQSNDGEVPRGNQRTANLNNFDSDTLAPITQDILKIIPKNPNVQYYGTKANIGSQREKRNPKSERTPAMNRRHRKTETSRLEDNEENVNPPQQPTKSNYNSIPPDPEGFDEREGPEGAYSHETEPVYDSVLKITLPRYMLTRSEHEDVFDEVLKSG